MGSFGKSMAALVVLALAACDTATPTENAIEEAQGPEGEAVPPGSEAASECLEDIWQAREAMGDFDADAERRFDQQHDSAKGGAISCATGTSASQFEATLTALRAAATDSDRAGLLAEAGIPLLFITADGETRKLESPEALEAAFDTVFAPATIEKLRILSLDDMTVVPGKGGFFELGAFWLVVPELGARPQLATVNDQAAAEAALLEDSTT